MKNATRFVKKSISFILILAILAPFGLPKATAYESITPASDDMVRLVQRWLNQEYGHALALSPARVVLEDGITGWGTIRGLIRALQYELGLRTGFADTFGPTTRNLYEQNMLQPGSNGRLVSILQGSLWCKGYSPGWNNIRQLGNGTVVIDQVFDINVENAIISLKRDAYGVLNQNGIVTSNVMASLMSMDAFRLVGGGRAEIRTMQQRLNSRKEYFQRRILYRYANFKIYRNAAICFIRKRVRQRNYGRKIYCNNTAGHIAFSKTP
jgi:hypothetical protein